MYVESVDGNYIGVQRGVAGTTATSHRSLEGTGVTDDDKIRKDATAAHQVQAGPPLTAGMTDAIPAHGWVTIWKRDTAARSYYLDADVTAANMAANMARVARVPICC